uniref:GDSL esterase/lipase n=1 Tax=Aegilops tauschii subsp. strangulata TaxID=200361 RepID=A0A453TAC6_AEGTS
MSSYIGTNTRGIYRMSVGEGARSWDHRMRTTITNYQCTFCNSNNLLTMHMFCMQNVGKNIPLSTQVRYFASTKAEMETAWGRHEVSKLLASSFFLLSIGNNDLLQSTPKSHADVVALYTILVSNYSAAITDLYGMGARKFGIISAGPVGCFPRVRLLSTTVACHDGLNRLALGLAAAFKSGLTAALAPNRLPASSTPSPTPSLAHGPSSTTPTRAGFRMVIVPAAAVVGWAQRVTATEMRRCAATAMPTLSGTTCTPASGPPSWVPRHSSMMARRKSPHPSASNSWPTRNDRLIPDNDLESTVVSLIDSNLVGNRSHSSILSL